MVQGIGVAVVVVGPDVVVVVVAAVVVFVVVDCCIDSATVKQVYRRHCTLFQNQQLDWM